MIKLEHVSKEFETRGKKKIDAVNDVSLTINSGEIFGIIGFSGAGKSTLVRCINLLEHPTKGKVFLNDVELTAASAKELRQERRSIGMIFQQFNLLAQKTCIDNITFPLIISGVPKKEAIERAKELLELVDLSDKAKAYPEQLSGGQKQRVAIARALATYPEVLLCDEATSALDPQTSASILKLLAQINRQFRITIVIITHQMSVVRQICNKVAIMSLGEIKEKGTVNEIFTHPKSPEARELLLRDADSGYEEAEQIKELLAERKIRIVYSSNSSFEPVIANMVLMTGKAVNILRANTRNVGGTAKGEMILGLPEDPESQDLIIRYLRERGLEVEEVIGNV